MKSGIPLLASFLPRMQPQDLFFLNEWVRKAGATVVYVTYEFAPQAPFPTGLEQVIAVYRALREGTHADRIGFQAIPLVVAGLSAGGNLAVAAVISPFVRASIGACASNETSRIDSNSTSRIESEDDELRGDANGRSEAHRRSPSPTSPSALQMPDAMLLLCPVLNLNRSPSPSRIAFAADTILPAPLLQAFGSAYDGGDGGPEKWSDPLLSPAFASDDVLRRLPPTR